jgi:putative oxidoreductase
MLTRTLRSLEDGAYTFLRIAAGLMFAFHGLQKLFGVLSNFRAPTGSQIWIGAVIELVAGLAIAAGAFTPWAAFIASGEMAVAYIQFHWKFAGGSRLIPAVNQGELALLYCAVFLYVACRGSGRWSLDSTFSRAPASTGV